MAKALSWLLNEFLRKNYEFLIYFTHNYTLWLCLEKSVAWLTNSSEILSSFNYTALPPSINHMDFFFFFFKSWGFSSFRILLRGSVCKFFLRSMDWDYFRKYLQQPPTNTVYLKTLVIGSELVSMKKGVENSAEEFQMSELHIHELQAPVAHCLPADS